MLSREIMGLLALGILWVNAGLVFAVALKQLQRLLSLRRRAEQALRRGELVVGTARPADQHSPFARRRVQQTGRALTTEGPDRILFTDGAQSFAVHGGSIETDEGVIEVPAAPAESSEVWPDGQRVSEAARCPSAGAFDAAYGDASRFKGYAREVDVEVRAGDRVWVLGRREGDRLVPFDDRPLVVSMVEPRRWATGRARLVVGFLLAAVSGLIVCTGLALWPPHFGWVSTVGGVLGLAYFLGIQPLGTSVRDAVRTPARQPVGGLWTRPAQPSVATVG